MYALGRVDQNTCIYLLDVIISACIYLVDMITSYDVAVLSPSIELGDGIAPGRDDVSRHRHSITAVNRRQSIKQASPRSGWLRGGSRGMVTVKVPGVTRKTIRNIRHSM